MIALYILAGLSLLLWIYCRFCYIFVRQSADTFWRFLRRELVPGASVPVQIIDLLVKLSAISLLIYWLWLRF